MTILRWVLGGAGVVLMAYAIGGALTDDQLKPAGVLVFLAAVLIVHDAIWMPALLAAGEMVARGRKGFARIRRSRGR